MHILLVEDNLRLQELIEQALRGAGYRVDVATTVAELLAAVASVQYDLLIVDLMLPDGDGLDAIRTLRARRSSVPILIMTARGSIDDRVRGLDAGADDYLIKPIHQAELLAHVRALLRRPAEVMGPILRTGNTEFDEVHAEVRCSGKPVKLRLRERRLLALLMRRSGFLVSKNMIEEALSEFGREISANAIEALISRIRRALSDAHSDVLIETVRGVGYRLTAAKGE
jgi:two-component system, OmpR family, response regulator